MTHQKLKDFWINKIINLINDFSLDPATLNEGTNWANKINALGKWKEIDILAAGICRDVYAKAGKTAPASILNKDENYGKLLGNTFDDYESQFADLVNVFKTKLGVDPLDDTTVKDGDEDILKWKSMINGKFPFTDRQYTLKDMGGSDLLDLLYERDLYLRIINNLDGLILKGKNLANAYGYKGWTSKINDTALQEYKNAKTIITNAETHLGLNSGDLATITTNAAYNLNGKTLAQLLTPHTCPPCPQTHCPTAHADYDTIKGESAEYQRISTKLSGKVSNDDLTNLLNSVPCSHTDYDTIKQERDELKQQKDNYSTEKQQAIQDKEKEIINKIITDLGLATERERERERTLEAVITEIKAKLTPPTCNKCPGKDSKITELETKITSLQTPKTLKDLPISKGIKEEVIKISQELGLTTQSCAKLEKATSYQELSSLQNQAFQEKLDKEVSDKNSANYLNWGLGILTLGSIVALAWMLIKQSKKDLAKLGEGKANF